MLPSPIVFPTLQFKDAIRRTCKNKIINLKYEQYNDEYTVAMLKDLEDDISSWFRFDERGKAVFLHLSDGKRKLTKIKWTSIYSNKTIKYMKIYPLLENYKGDFQIM